MEQTVISLEATPGGVIETLQIADPKDPFGVRLLIREWFDVASSAAGKAKPKLLPFRRGYAASGRASEAGNKVTHPPKKGSPMNATAIAPAVAPEVARTNIPANALATSVPRVDARPAGADWKKFIIFQLDSSGRPELLADTNLASEADRFDTLGYLVSTTLDPDALDPGSWTKTKERSLLCLLR